MPPTHVATAPTGHHPWPVPPSTAASPPGQARAPVWRTPAEDTLLAASQRRWAPTWWQRRCAIRRARPRLGAWRFHLLTLFPGWAGPGRFGSGDSHTAPPGGPRRLGIAAGRGGSGCTTPHRGQWCAAAQPLSAWRPAIVHRGRIGITPSSLPPPRPAPGGCLSTAGAFGWPRTSFAAAPQGAPAPQGRGGLLTPRCNS